MATDKYPNFYLYKRIVQAKLFIDTNYDRKIEISHIADAAHFSKFHFIRVFKKTYGKTPHQYLISVRIDMALLLFKNGVPVSEAYYLVGFESLTSFSALFKKEMGTSPSSFLKQHIIRKQEIKQNPLNYVSSCFAYKLGWSKNSNFEEVQ
ncbi:MAG: AraC family transcriptional regulator [Flavobacterium sp.]|uniref:AraC family transcriptional regulator n=1 Tax=Flavobacterium sp. TaxID=239 RepID=UPI0032664EEB